MAITFYGKAYTILLELDNENSERGRLWVKLNPNTKDELEASFGCSPYSESEAAQLAEFGSIKRYSFWPEFF